MARGRYLNNTGRGPMLKEELTSLSVALLVGELEIADAISGVFKDMGVRPHFYQDLKTFWDDVSQLQPTLSVVDVTMMSEGELQLKNHPLAKSGRLNLAFTYSEESRPLLLSTFDLDHFGSINFDGFVKAEVKAVLKNLNRALELEQKKNEVLKLETRVNRLIHRQESLKEKNFYRSLYNGVIERFEATSDEEDFFSSCATVFGSLDEVDSFTFFELSTNQKRLISPDKEWRKYKSIPSIWLGKKCEQGIEYFAQNMAMQTSFDIFGEEFMSLLIKGQDKNPQKLIFVKVKDEAMLAQFDWNQLESYLSGLNSRFINKLSDNIERPGRLVDPYQFLSLIEENNPVNKGSTLDHRVKHSLFVVDFKELVSSAITKGGYRFHWHRFLDDFLSRFQSMYNQDFHGTMLGIEFLCFLVPTENKNEFGRYLNDFSLRYAYWKYFEDTDIVLGKSLKPTVEELPNGVKELLDKMFYGEELDAQNVQQPEEELTLDQQFEKIVWGKGADQVM
jgi:hypothetical protein